ncbi:hypothetical protein [Kitasatospora purpeofusca]|uniref:hypothetical protein n=1 Tax=Kitasatospora purpeofusca TaxID=67352 RepID=UPI0036D2ACE0
MLTATVGQLGGAPAVPPVRAAERQRPRPAVSPAPRPQGFSFFGRGSGAAVRAAAPAPAVRSVEELGERADLADVVGDEAVAAQAREQSRDQEQAAARAAGAEAQTRVLPQVGDADPEVVDLTPHDETEQIEVPELRASR